MDMAWVKKVKCENQVLFKAQTEILIDKITMPWICIKKRQGVGILGNCRWSKIDWVNDCSSCIATYKDAEYIILLRFQEKKNFCLQRSPRISQELAQVLFKSRRLAFCSEQ